MKAMISLFFFSFVTSQVAWAHGDDMPGPHGGKIQMPASFHTELVAKQEKVFHVYLLDMDFKNPTTKNSDLKVIHDLDGKKTELKCRTRGDHYICQSEGKITKGSLLVQATRDGVKATSEALYHLPITP